MQRAQPRSESETRLLGLRQELTFKANIKNGRHGWLRLTPAYSLHLVEELIEKGGRTQRILDPFSGTGTTPLACAEHGIRGDAIDINPFLVWLGNLKLQKFGRRDVNQFLDYAERVMKKSTMITRDTWLPNLADIQKWWNASQLLALGRLAQAIREIPTEDARLRSLAHVAFCKASIDCAKVSFGHQSMSFKKPSKQLHLLSEEDRHGLDGVGTFFEAAAKVVANSLLINEPKCDGNTVFLGDSRNLDKVVGDRRYTTVVTSPPYPNRMSYIRELRPYMYWLQYLESGKEAGDLDWRSIGGTWGSATGNLATWRPRPDIRVPYEGFEETVAAITRGHKLLGPYVAKYFEDVVLHVRSLRKVLDPAARVYYVVGNSKFYDIMLHTEALYESILRSEGFLQTNIRTIRKRTSKKELFEYVVEAVAPGA